MQTELSQVKPNMFHPRYWVFYGIDSDNNGILVARGASPGTSMGVSFWTPNTEYDIFIKLVGEARFVYTADTRVVLEWYDDTAGSQLAAKTTHGHASTTTFSSASITHTFAQAAGAGLHIITLRAYASLVNQVTGNGCFGVMDIARV